MATYYMMVCDDHKERTDAVSRNASGCCFCGEGDTTLVPFIIAHAGCKVRIVHEDDPAAYDDTMRDWKMAEIELEIHKAKRDNRWK